MKLIILILTVLLSTSTVLSQNKWERIEIDLIKQYRNKEITLQEYKARIRKEAGSIGGLLQAWHETTDTLETASENQEIKLYFAEDLIIKKGKTSVYMQMYLENHSNEEFIMQRIDATIGKIIEYFLIDNKWIKGRSNHMSMCGNSYFDVKFESKQRVYFQLGNRLFKKGENNTKYKVVIELKGTNENRRVFIESNVIEVALLSNQRKRLATS